MNPIKPLAKQYKSIPIILICYSIVDFRRDFEQVEQMKQDKIITERIKDELELARKVALSEMKLRGKGFTLDQLIEQQELFQRGNQLSG